MQFEVKLSAAEVTALDRITGSPEFPGKRTCTDCYTNECQACGRVSSPTNDHFMKGKTMILHSK